MERNEKERRHWRRHKVKATRYPLDYDALKKGDVIPAAQLERILSRKRGTERYHLQLLTLRDEIERQLAIRGAIVAVRTFGDTLKILTDEEAAEHCPRRVHLGIRHAFKNHRKSLAVELPNLSDEKRRELLRTNEINSKMLSAATEARREAIRQLSSHKRSRPGLPNKEHE